MRDKSLVSTTFQAKNETKQNKSVIKNDVLIQRKKVKKTKMDEIENDSPTMVLIPNKNQGPILKRTTETATTTMNYCDTNEGCPPTKLPRMDGSSKSCPLDGTDKRPRHQVQSKQPWKKFAGKLEISKNLFSFYFKGFSSYSFLINV